MTLEYAYPTDPGGDPLFHSQIREVLAAVIELRRRAADQFHVGASEAFPMAPLVVAQAALESLAYDIEHGTFGAVPHRSAVFNVLEDAIAGIAGRDLEDVIGAIGVVTGHTPW